MPAPPTPIDLANTVVRNLVPLGGILFLDWSAVNVLILYFADTMLAMAVMFAGLMRHFMPPTTQPGIAARINAEVGCVATALFLAAFMAVPLGLPLIFILSGTDVTIGSLFADQTFRAGLVLQAIAAAWSGKALYGALQTHTPEQLRLKRRFALVFLRWMVILMASYTGLVFLFGRFAPFVFVAIYAATSIVIDVAPEKFLRALPGGAEDAEPLPATPSLKERLAKSKFNRKRK